MKNDPDLIKAVANEVHRHLPISNLALPTVRCTCGVEGLASGKEWMRHQADALITYFMALSEVSRLCPEHGEAMTWDDVLGWWDCPIDECKFVVEVES